MHSATLNDDIFLDSLEHFTISGIAEHLPNFLVVSKFSPLSENTETFRRDFSNFDGMRSIEWALLFSCNSDPSCVFDTFFPAEYQSLLIYTFH